jgi:hypothetical protein
MFHFKIMHLADKTVYNSKKIKISIFTKKKITPFQEIITKRTLIKNKDLPLLNDLND